MAASNACVTAVRGRTGLARALCQAHKISLLAQQPHRPPADELLAIWREKMTRREFLKRSAQSLAVLTVAGSLPLLEACNRKAFSPRVAIVGAGLAGLNAARILKKGGLTAQVYEASTRVGGRVYTAKDLLGADRLTELGGEFIDSGHLDILALVKEFDLELIDLHDSAQAGLQTLYYFGGRKYAMKDLLAAYQPFAERIQADADRTADVVDFEHEGGAGRLDRMSLSDYFNRLDIIGWLRSFLEVAYVTEYGLETGEQSALNFIFMVDTDLADGDFSVFGASDERFKIKGGNGALVRAMQKRVQHQISTGYRLLALRSTGIGYQLSFGTEGGGIRDVDADVVLLALPFTLLREVDIRVELPAFKRRAIDQLGYGSNAKIFAGFNQRVWHQHGFSGEVFSDLSSQLLWDNSVGQSGEAGGLTSFLGGTAGLRCGAIDSAQWVTDMLKQLEKVIPKLPAAFNGQIGRFHWPSHPYTKGSYACYRPGQWTRIAGAEFRPVGNLFFAGEHCSSEYQGYMNGAAETGRLAAEAILKLIK